MTNPTIEDLVDPKLCRSQFPTHASGYVNMDNVGGSQTLFYRCSDRNPDREMGLVYFDDCAVWP